MPLSNSPGGLSSYGIPVVGGSKIPGGAVRFVGNRAGLPASNGTDATRPTSTLASALGSSAIARANSGGTVVVLPGHTESTATTSFTGLAAGTRIVGTGEGSQRPTIRLTDTAASLAISVADVTFENVIFRLEGANGITRAINVTGAGVTFQNCEFEVASGATAKAAIALEIGAGAHRCRIVSCVFRGTATHNVTDCIKITGAVDQVAIVGCEMVASATAGNGLIHVTAAATNLKILGNYIYNTMTSSTSAITIDDVACDGIIADNYCGVKNNGTAASQGIVFAGTTNPNVVCFQNYTSDEKQKSGVLSPAAAT